MKLGVNSPCPCGSGIKYKKCCGVFHKGKLPQTALELMKSRYSAFAFGDSKYIIKTTHPGNPDYTTDTSNWNQSISEFCKTCSFDKLEILEFIDEEDEAYVTFHATIFCGNKNHSFSEKSKFFKVDNRWLYHSGEFL